MASGMRWGPAIAGILLLTLGGVPSLRPLHGQPVRTILDARIAMRDGIELSADIWLPAEPGPVPTVLIRTPYLKTVERRNEPEGSRNGELGLLYARAGYALVVQDARGRGDSDGDFGFFFADAEDGHDTIEWIATQPWSNGKVGMMGRSYRATVQWLAAREGSPHLRCIAPAAPAGRYFDELPYHGGAFMPAWSVNWINGTSGRIEQFPHNATLDWERILWHRPLIDMDRVVGRPLPLLREVLEHPTLDPYWSRIKFEPEDFEAIDIPALTTTGWFDADQPGALFYWDGMRDNSPARDRQYLIIGPWNHGETYHGFRFDGSHAHGELTFGENADMDLRRLFMEYFDWCLKGDAEAAFDLPRARAYLTGSNQWMDFSQYPPPEAEELRLYLRSGGNANTLRGDGRLTLERPSGQEPPDRFTFDPRDPVPASISDQLLPPDDYGVDHRSIERRPDVLVYTTDALLESVHVIGTVFVRLFAATDGQDTDFTAKLLDVYPDGRAVRLGSWPAGVIRARFRAGYDQERLLTPGEIGEYSIDLHDFGHTFLPSHRIRIEVSSSAFPFINPNQNTGNPVATDTEWRVAQQTVYHDAARLSHLVLPIVRR